MTVDDKDSAPAPEGAGDTIEDNLRGRRAPSVASRNYLFVLIEGARPLAGGARFSLDRVDEIHIGRGEHRTATIEKADGGSGSPWDSSLGDRIPFEQQG